LIGLNDLHIARSDKAEWYIKRCHVGQVVHYH